jgi:hypothetical protein
MKAIAPTAILLLALFAWAAPAVADTADARCEFVKDGHTKDEESGPCSFSQRQGYVDIELRGGKRFSLSPANKPDHFEDEKGLKVVRDASGDRHVYKWEDGKKVIVHFEAPHGRHGGGHASQPQPKVDFDDLRIGSASRAERGLEDRGFVAVDGSQSASGFSNLWMFNRKTGQCVQLETAEGKVMTINEVTHPKCR